MVKNYLESDSILEERITIENIPGILFRPKNIGGKLPTIILYHGWSSSKEFQRIRGFIFASVGFQVFLPDAINHGEREPLDVYNLENAKNKFWQTIKQNVDESDILIDALVDKYRADKDKIGIIGNSMGGFSAAGIFVKNKDINSLVVLNGSSDWEKSNKLFSRNLFKDEDEDDVLVIDKELEKYNPMRNLDRIKDRPILMLHGTTDSLVPIDGQDSFYEAAKMNYSDTSKLKYMRYNNLNHFVTTNMMEESIIWFKKHMS